MKSKNSKPSLQSVSLTKTSSIQRSHRIKIMNPKQIQKVCKFLKQKNIDGLLKYLYRLLDLGSVTIDQILVTIIEGKIPLDDKSVKHLGFGVVCHEPQGQLDDPVLLNYIRFRCCQYVMERGDRSVLVCLANSYFYGYGVDKNPRLAENLCRKAIILKDMDACYLLGVILMAQDKIVEAITLFEQVKNGYKYHYTDNHIDALLRLRKLYTQQGGSDRLGQIRKLDIGPIAEIKDIDKHRRAQKYVKDGQHDYTLFLYHAIKKSYSKYNEVLAEIKNITKQAPTYAM